ncbi:hypothetical protein B0T25DRAFT_238856 [Lasiosphaeria hispida]|uniref:Uncharacterized protein n=1 Tax=Lasiosphaeria hispida TaxID=260671 RepID=A0AAJ0HEF9_9PEZI|nr:hypothetical protein B0T25DRAFT_238856 [Lasiosphaeria hispida]
MPTCEGPVRPMGASTSVHPLKGRPLALERFRPVRWPSPRRGSRGRRQFLVNRRQKEATKTKRNKERIDATRQADCHLSTWVFAALATQTSPSCPGSLCSPQNHRPSCDRTPGDGDLKICHARRARMTLSLGQLHSQKNGQRNVAWWCLVV